MSKNRNREKENTMTAEHNELNEFQETGISGADQAAAVPAAEAAATVDENKADDRFKFVTDPETGEQVKRKDYILKLYVQKGMKKGDIARHLTKITGKKVEYQIVFQATKGVVGGPVADSIDPDAAAVGPDVRPPLPKAEPVTPAAE